MSFCESCGSEVPEDASFCGICGQAAKRSGGYGAAGERIARPENNLSVTGLMLRLVPDPALSNIPMLDRRGRYI